MNINLSQKIKSHNFSFVDSPISSKDKTIINLEESNKKNNSIKKLKERIFEYSKKINLKEIKEYKANLLLNNRKYNIINKLYNYKSKIISKNREKFEIKKFEIIYSQKNEYLLSLIKEFNNRINLLYLYIFNKTKFYNNTNLNCPFENSEFNNISPEEENNDLHLFVNKLINFKENQIKYYLKLLEFLEKYEKEEIVQKLNELYNKLDIYNNNSEKRRIIKKKKNNNPLTLRNEKIHKFPILKDKINISSSLIEDNNKKYFLKKLNNQDIYLDKSNNMTTNNSFTNNKYNTPYNLKFYNKGEALTEKNKIIKINKKINIFDNNLKELNPYLFSFTKKGEENIN